MGLLEDMVARSQWTPTAGGFPGIVPPIDEAALAAEARDAAGRKLVANTRKRPPNPFALAPDANSAGIQLAMDQAPEGTGVPFSAQAGMLAPPITMPSGEPGASVPLPVARPAAADASPAPPTDVSAAARPLGAPINVMPPPAAAPAPATADSPSMFGRLGGGLMDGLSNNSNALLAFGAGFAGAPTIGQGISRASAAMIPAHAADVKQRLAQQTQGVGYKALIEAGVPPNLAQAALGNPAIMQSVTSNYLGDRKGELKEIGVDRYGNKLWGIFDPFTKTIKPVADALTPAASATTTREAGGGAPSAPGSSTATDISAAQRTGLAVGGTNGPVTAENDITGPDYLERLKETDPAYARQVEQVLNGDAAMPTGRQAQTPFGRKLRQDVLTVEPGASDSDFSTRQKTQADYTSGNSAKVTKSINTTLHHAETLERAIKDLDNFNTLPGVLNPVRSAIKGQYDPKYQRASGQYETSVANFAKELDFAVSGGRPTVSGTKHQMEGFDLNAPKEKQLAKLQEGVDLLKGRLESHTEGFNKGMRKRRDPIDFIDPVNRKFYQRLLGEGGATVEGEPPATAPAATAAAPKPGRYVFDPASGKLVPE